MINKILQIICLLLVSIYSSRLIAHDKALTPEINASQATTNLSSDIKISSVISHDKNKLPHKVIMYTFNGPFYGGIYGDSIRNNFYNLLLGKKLDIHSYPHIILIENNDIADFMAMLDTCPYIGNSGSRYPNINYSLLCFPTKERLSIINHQGSRNDVWALIMIYFNKHDNPVFIWHIGHYLNYDGLEFDSHFFDDNAHDYGYIRYYELCKTQYRTSHQN